MREGWEARGVLATVVKGMGEKKVWGVFLVVCPKELKGLEGEQNRLVLL